MILTFQGNREKNPNRSLFSVEVDFDDKRVRFSCSLKTYDNLLTLSGYFYCTFADYRDLCLDSEIVYGSQIGHRKTVTLFSPQVFPAGSRCLGCNYHGCRSRVPTTISVMCSAVFTCFA